MKPFLWTVLAVSGALLVARAAIGPFRLIGLSVATPINIESFAAVSMLLLLAMNARKDSEVPSPEALQNWQAIALLCAAGIAAWLWTLWFPFLADDYTHISNSLRATPLYLGQLFTVPAADRFFRPFVFLIYAAEAKLWGADRAAWHAASIGLHFVNSILVYALVRSRSLGRFPALAAALFFLLNGSRPEAVAWISAQFDLLATLFFLAALLALDRHVRTRDWRWQAASLTALLLALLSKESAYVFPLVAMLMLWVHGVRGRRAARLIVPSVALTAAVFVYRWRLLRGIGGYQMADSGKPFFYSVDLFRTGKALFLRLPAVLNFPLNWTRLPEWWLAVLIAAAIVGLGALAAARARRNEVWLALGLLLVCAVPVHQFLLIDANLEKSRVLYLPSVGFALLVAVALAALPQRSALIAATAILAFQAAALEHNLSIWKSIAELAERTCASASREAQAANGPVLLSDVPNDIDGVYFLHTGLRSCVEWAGAPPDKLLLQIGPATPGTRASRVLQWDSARRNWRAE